MLTWILPAGWILMFLTDKSATCRDSAGEIIVIDILGA